MDHDSDIQLQVWQRTLSEIEHSTGDGEAERHPCVICLDDVSEPAIALPCQHNQFDFICLASWLEERTLCPLCKSEIRTVRYNIKSDTDYKVYVVKEIRGGSVPRPQRRPLPPRPPRRYRQREYERPVAPELAVKRRREVYRRLLYSLHVGSNRISRFQNLSPEMFARDLELVSRARKWIRRELKVFEYLNPSSEREAQDSFIRSNNAEFLLEYCIAILKTINVRDSSGQAEDMLQEFLGRDNAKLFLHELCSWLRSPYSSLEAWDSHVQYSESLDLSFAEPDRGRMSRNSHEESSSRKRRRSVEDRSEDDNIRSRPQRNAMERAHRAYDSYRPRY